MDVRKHLDESIICQRAEIRQEAKHDSVDLSHLLSLELFGQLLQCGRVVHLNVLR